MLIQYIRNDRRFAPIIILVVYSLLSIWHLGLAYQNEALQSGILKSLPINLSSLKLTFLGLSLLAAYFIGSIIYLLAKEHFLKDRNFYFTPWFFIWGIIFFSLNKPIGNSIIVLALLLFALIRVLKLFNIPRPQKELFDASFAIGLASIFYPVSGIFLIWLLACIFVYQLGNIKYFILCILSFCSPYLFLYTIAYLFDLQVFSLNTISLEFEPKLSLPIHKWQEFAFLGIYFMLSIIGSIDSYNKLSLKPIKERKSFLAVNLLLFTVVISSFFAGSNITTQLILSCLSTCFLWSNFFSHQKNFKLLNFLFILWLIGAIFFVLA